jgi:hypothetical protein
VRVIDHKRVLFNIGSHGMVWSTTRVQGVDRGLLSDSITLFDLVGCSTSSASTSNSSSISGRVGGLGSLALVPPSIEPPSENQYCKCCSSSDGT